MTTQNIESTPAAPAGSALHDVHDLVRAAVARLQTVPPPAPDDDGGAALAGFVNDQLAAERDRRTQLNGRGTGLITTASSLATLLFAGSALITAPTGYHPPHLALWALVPTLLAFIGAGLCGIIAAQSTFCYSVVQARQLEDWRNDNTVWANSQENVLRLLTKANIITLGSLRVGNNRKMLWVRIGFWTQIGALAALGVVVGAILAAALWPHSVGWLHMLAPV